MEKAKKRKSLHEMSDSGSDEETQVVKKPPPKKNNSIHEISDSDEEPVPSSSSAIKTSKRKSSGSLASAASKRPKMEDKRPFCKYGTECFRKNPSHYKDFRHPEGHEEKILAALAKYARSASSTKESPKKHQSLSSAEVVKRSEPFNLLFTKVTGIDEKYNRNALDLQDILSPSMGTLEKSVQFNYCIDIPWLVSQYPEEFRTCPLLVVHGMHKEEKKGLENDAKPYSNVTLCAAPMDIPFGTHHTKMMILKYKEGLRVVITTANLMERDWFQKTQGIWVSPLCKTSPNAATNGDSSTNFRRDLTSYLKAYKARALMDWVKIIEEHDMSSVNVHMIASVPGRHAAENKYKWGHMKLRNLLVAHGPDSKSVHKWPVVGQFSSVGSLGANKQAWVCGEWLSSMTSCKGLAGGIQAQANPLHLVFPSKDNIRLSLEGYAAGGSVPYSINTARKQPWFHDFLCQWKADANGRTVASPHIKTFCRPSPDFDQLAWFLLTSANMSKAAWGAFEKGGSQLMIRSYEMGVLFLPGSNKTENGTFFGVKGKESDVKKQMQFPVPIDLPPVPYVKGKDRPWIWDIPYVDKPDTHGTKWCPPLK